MRRSPCPAIVLLLSLLVPAAGQAQGIARTLDELRLLTRPGETISVVGAGGTETSGRITTLTPSSVLLEVNGAPREWKEDEILRIRQRRSDSLANGALWGLGIGAGLMGLGVAAVGVEEGDAGWAALAIAVYGGLGAGIGVGIDALITRQYVIFERPATTARWRLEPIVSPRARGARLRLRF